MTEDDSKYVYRQPLKRMIKDKDMRSSEASVDLLKKQIEDHAEEIVERAETLASHADRKTIRKSDMREAINQLT